MSQSTVTDKKLVATLQTTIDLTLGVGNGMSQMDLIVEGLTNHRDYYLQQMFYEIKNGEYENAHSHYQNFKHLSYLLDQLLLDIGDLAYNNYAACHFKGSAQDLEKELDSKVKLRKESYDEFLTMILCTKPEETEEAE